MIRWVQATSVPRPLRASGATEPAPPAPQGQAVQTTSQRYEYVEPVPTVTTADVHRMRELRTDMVLAFAGLLVGAAFGAFTSLRCGESAEVPEADTED